eukprot:jgi/Psemu1/19005/gm1.19005_g
MTPLSLTPLLLFATSFMANSSLNCMAANLRASAASLSSSEDAITIPNDDLLSMRSYLVISIDGFGMEGLDDMSPEKQAVMECAFHEAFDEVHGDRDGIYLSGQQIVATDEVEEDDDPDNSARVEFIDFNSREKYRRRYPRYPRPRPTDRPSHTSASVHSDPLRCSMPAGPDDDAMETTSKSLLLNTKSREQAQLETVSKKTRDERMASDFVLSEASMNAIADAMRSNLIEGSCVSKGDDTFEYIQNTDVFPLSQADFEASLAAIEASTKAKALETNAISGDYSTIAPPSSPEGIVSLPFYYGGVTSPHTDTVTETVTNQFFKIGFSGIDCGPWNNQDLFDVNSALHDSINSLKGLNDRGHVIDKIIGTKGTAKHRKYTWKCQFDMYSKLDVTGEMSDSALDDIGDSLCADLYQFGSGKFQNAIDCNLKPLSSSEYSDIVVREDSGLLAKQE